MALGQSWWIDKLMSYPRCYVLLQKLDRDMGKVINISLHMTSGVTAASFKAYMTSLFETLGVVWMRVAVGSIFISILLKLSVKWAEWSVAKWAGSLALPQIDTFGEPVGSGN